jgi:hypothetical protein
MIRTIVICCVVVILFDAVAAVISKVTGISYGSFTIAQVILYFVLGFALRRTGATVLGALVPVVVASFAEDTVGLWVSVEILPGQLHVLPVPLMVVSGLIVLAAMTLIGAVGIAVGSINRRSRVS